jgi:hypothetical protein
MERIIHIEYLLASLEGRSDASLEVEREEVHESQLDCCFGRGRGLYSWLPLKSE